MAQDGEVLVPNTSKADSADSAPTIPAYITFNDTLLNDGIEVGVECHLRVVESKSSVDSDGKGRTMLQIVTGKATDDPRKEGKNMTYKAYGGFIGAYDKTVKFTKVKKD